MLTKVKQVSFGVVNEKCNDGSDGIRHANGSRNSCTAYCFSAAMEAGHLS